MNKYKKVAEIPVIKNGKEVKEEINYRDAFIVYLLRTGLKVTQFPSGRKLAKQTIYNCTSALKARLMATTNIDLARKFDHIDFKKILSWLFFTFITSPGWQQDIMETINVAFC